jgi:hypothetical protein
MVPLIVREGLEAWKGECGCGHDDDREGSAPQ